MPSAKQIPTAAALFKAIEGLPQSTLVHELDARAWVNSVLIHEPERAVRHLERCAGFGGSDMGVLLASYEGLFHPFSDAYRVTRTKLFLDPMEAPTGHRRRGMALEPVAQSAYRSLVESRGGKSRDDVLEAIAQYQRQQRPAEEAWLVGHIDDVVEESGKLYVVDYKSPSAAQFQDMKGQDVPFYYEAQLHHYKNLAQKAGFQIEGLRLYAFGADEWQGIEKQVPIRPALCEKLLKIGTYFWQSYVMEGLHAPEVMLATATSLEELALTIDGKVVEVSVADTAQRDASGAPVYTDTYALNGQTFERFREQLTQLGVEIFGHSVLRGEADEMRKMLIRNVRDVLPIQAIPPDVNRIDLGPVRIKLDWEYHPDRLVDAIRGALALAGSSDEEIQRLLESDNFCVPAGYSSEGLVRLLKEKKGIDVNNDPDFLPAQSTPSKHRLETLVSLLRDLERRLVEPVRWEDLIDYSASQLNVELVRTPVAGIGRELREQTAAEFRQVAVPAARDIGARHQQRLQEVADEGLSPTPKARRRSRP